VAGTTVKVVWDYAGPITGTQTVTSTVGSQKTFEGQQAVETVATTTGTNTVAGVTTSIDTVVKAYTRKTGAAEITYYGALVTASQQVLGFSIPMETKTVWTPPWVDHRYTLGVGEQLTQTYSGSTTITTGGVLGSPSTVTTQPTPVSNVVKFVGIESVTVPAGTYNACKFQDWAVATPTEVTTTWLIVGKGMLVKTLAVTKTGTQTISATSLTLNGQKL
jgi:hypothetical protein